MYVQTLNRDFALAVADATTDLIRTTVANREAGLGGAASPLDEIDTATLQQFAADLAGAAEAERAAPLETEQAEQIGDRPPPPKEDRAFVPRDPLLGVLQTTFEQFAAEAGAPTRDDPLPDDRRSGPLPNVTDLRIAGVEFDVTDEDRRVWRRMEVATGPLKFLSDPGWAKSLLAMAHRRIHGKVAWNPKPTIAPPIAGDARIIILGDWGSGLPRARAVAEQVQKCLDEASRTETHVIHLGDVYYSGWPKEYEQNFLDPWPVKDRHAGVGSWALAGNHDMYTGGEGYFQTALGDPRFAAQQRSSWFALANDHWQILGLDSSYEDGGLHGDQADWVRDMRRSNPGRKTVLLTHHQLFSAYQAGAKKLRLKTRWLLDEQPVDAWFWGHEHRCLAYRDHERVRFASCVGHGGIPEYLHKAPLTPSEGLVYEYRKIHSTDWQPWITFGFAVVELRGPRMTIRYIDEDGNEHCTLEHE